MTTERQDDKETMGRAERARLLAERFKGEDWNSNTYRKIHVADGVLVATNGQILLHVEDGGIHKEEGDGESRKILEFGSGEGKDGYEFVAGAEWCRGRLREEAFRIARGAEAEAARMTKEETARVRRARQNAMVHCPCCGETLYIWGDELLTEGRMDELEEGSTGFSARFRNKSVAVVTPDGRRTLFNAVYLDLAMRADLELGGLKGLWMCREKYFSTAAFLGTGWFVVVMSFNNDSAFEADATVRVEDGGERPTEGPRQDGDGERRTEPARQDEGGEA